MYSWDWEKIMDTLHNDITIVDKNGVIVYINGALEEVYSVSKHYLLGKTVDDMEKGRIFFPSAAKAVFRSGKKETLIQESGTGNKVFVTATPFYDEAGELMYVVCCANDITELLQLREHLQTVEKEMETVKEELDKLRNTQSLTDIPWSSQCMVKVENTIRKVAEIDVSVLLTGESGVGKTTFARQLHHQSSRKGKPFVEINCGSIPESLLESELFGFEPGAFSGASQKGKKGLVEQAEKGTLFLDEIGELPMKLQVKLLTLIQEKTFYRVGGTTPKKVDFRLVAATNVDLLEKVERGEFRQDLYFRLIVFPISIPPLRERSEDILRMLLSFLDRFNQLYDRRLVLHQRAIDKLLAYRWPGNVRELEHMVQRLVLTVDDSIITVDDLPESIVGKAQTPLPEQANRTLPETLREVERMLLQQAYQDCKSTTEMAKVLGISQPSVVRKLKQYKSLFESE
ncbi:sigma 54-interacting transcriptional regulator [Brevibacillus nitrificans]|uniref:sigma-54 interaction domain-containing protein n=1 Tax=Brevibacillus nitrificans TaxID=651560 RepID=UPI002E1FD8A9|nr:sigma 54-interacting transcriptional regulator [Brevibacillus nitrificans]